MSKCYEIRSLDDDSVAEDTFILRIEYLRKNLMF